MKRTIQIIVLFCLSLWSVNATAQQMVLSSQYMVNSFAINPAAAGTKTYAPLVLDVRRQWAGIREAPVAQHLSYHTNITSKLGVGGYLFNDVAGPSRRTGFMGALSTQVAINRDAYLSLGLAVSLSQYVLDREKLITEEPNDITVDNYTSNLLIPDISGGLKLYAENYHLGFAVFNVLQTKTDLFDISTLVTNSLQRTMYLTGSYIIPLNSKESLFLEPSAVGRIMFNAPFQFDVNLRLAHEMGIWGAVSYRFKDAIALIIGYSNDYFGVSYSYDINNSPLRAYNSGSHEITLTLKGKNKSGGGFGGSKFRVINCPSF
jgi:type IX secretion system PorP/SprF family membrane protein